jgi:beta-fructofuranosidase
MVDSLPCSYSPLPNGPDTIEAPLAKRRPPKKATLIIFSGLLLLALFLAITIAGHHRNPYIHANENNESLLATSKPLEPVLPASRGVSAGVSEKSNRVFSGHNVVEFPWNNSMLSWQRTSFHFQPEKNWMNGMFYFGILNLFLANCFLNLFLFF